MENMSATIDKAFKVEMMKMPPSLLKTKMGDLLSGGFLAFLGLLCLLCLTSVLVFEEENSSSEVSIALKVSLVWSFCAPYRRVVDNAPVSVQNESLLAPPSLRKLPSRRGDADALPRPPDLV